MNHLTYFAEKVCNQLRKSGIDGVLTRVENHCVSCVFFFETFEVFNDIYKNVPYDFSIDLFRNENMACLKFYTSGYEEFLKHEYSVYKIMNN